MPRLRGLVSWGCGAAAHQRRNEQGGRGPCAVDGRAGAPGRRRDRRVQKRRVDGTRRRRDAAAATGASRRSEVDASAPRDDRCSATQAPGDGRARGRRDAAIAGREHLLVTALGARHHRQLMLADPRRRALRSRGLGGPSLPRGHSSTRRGDAAAATWRFRTDEARRRRGCRVDSPWRRRRGCRADSPWRRVAAPPRLLRG